MILQTFHLSSASQLCEAVFRQGEGHVNSAAPQQVHQDPDSVGGLSGQDKEESVRSISDPDTLWDKD